MKYSQYFFAMLIGALALSQTGIASAQVLEKPFSDVELNNPNLEAITFLKQKGIVGGYPDGTFKPEQAVNRAESLKMIMGISDFKYWDRADGAIFAGASTYDSKQFKDVKDKNEWYYSYVSKAYDNGLIQGYDDGTFKPSQKVNAVENLKILLNHTFLRIDKLDNVIGNVSENPYNDASKDQWYAKYVRYAQMHNMLTADSLNNIYPAVEMTRGKLAKVIYKAYLADQHLAQKWGVTVDFDEDLQKFVVKKADGSKLAELPEQDEERNAGEAYVKKVTAKNAYVSVCATGFGGYINYDFCYGNTYQINLSSGEVKGIDLKLANVAHLDFMDIAPNELNSAWYNPESHKIYVLPTGDSDHVQSFDVNAKYSGQAGDVKFSPDGKKVAYAGIVSNPDAEESGVFIIDLKSKKETKVIEGKGVFHVYGWTTLGSVDYGTEYTGW